MTDFHKSSMSNFMIIYPVAAMDRQWDRHDETIRHSLLFMKMHLMG